jgi:hypothetical protein
VIGGETDEGELDFIKKGRQLNGKEEDKDI